MDFDNEYEDYECLYSTSPLYESGKSHLLYDIKPLLRVLCLKRKLFSQKLEQDIYQSELQELCFILEWQDHARKILVFDLRDLDHFEDEEFLKIINNENEKLQQMFQKIYYGRLKK